MNTSFTPGPWTLGKGKVTIREVNLPGRKGFIARCHMPGEYRFRSEEESEANARLIAAAPSLYAALHNLVARGLIDPDSDHYDEAIEALNEATEQEP